MNSVVPHLNHPQDKFDSSADDEVIDLLQYWYILLRHKWQIFALAVVVGVGTVVVLFAMTPIYSSNARLLIEAEQATVVSIEEVYGMDSSQNEYYLTQFEILKSRRLAERVFDLLNIDTHPEYRDEAGESSVFAKFLPAFGADTIADPMRIRATKIERFRSNLAIAPIRKTQLVDLVFESSDPKLAKAVANALGEAYIDNYLESKLDRTRKASGWLTERLELLQADMEISAKKLRDFQESENLVDVAGVSTLTAKELGELTRRLVEVRNLASSAKSQLNSAGDLRGGYRNSWESLPEVLSDKLSQDLKSSEVAAGNLFSELKRRYGPKHPRYIAASDKYQSAEAAVRQRVQKVIVGLEDKYKQALADQREIEASTVTSKREIQDINRKGFELSKLKREAATTRQLYDLFFQRFKETSDTGFNAANARFVDRAPLPYVPVKPKKKLILALALVVSVIVGFLLAVLRDSLNNTIRSANELESKLGLGVLGVVPLEKLSSEEEQTAAHMYLSKKHVLFSEAVRSLRTSVILAGLDKEQKVIVVTSSVPGEGKTTTSSNLALALGQMEKVLYIDADMRRPSVAKEYGFERGAKGLAEVIARSSELSDVIRHMPELNIDVVAAGAVPPNPLDLLSSDRFVKMLDVLKTKYDRIVIDSAPTQAVSDSLVLSQHVDSLIFVVRSDATSTSVVNNAVERLRRVGAPIIGVVLNQFDADAAAKYGYYASGKYGYYGYGYSSASYD